MYSPSALCLSFSVVAPIVCTMMVTVPFSRSKSWMVMGMRSPFSSTRRMMNWPGSAFFATIGASISYRMTVGLSASFLTMRYIA